MFGPDPVSRAQALMAWTAWSSEPAARKLCRMAGLAECEIISVSKESGTVQALDRLGRRVEVQFAVRDPGRRGHSGMYLAVTMLTEEGSSEARVTPWSRLASEWAAVRPAQALPGHSAEPTVTIVQCGEGEVEVRVRFVADSSEGSDERPEASSETDARHFQGLIEDDASSSLRTSEVERLEDAADLAQEESVRRDLLGIGDAAPEDTPSGSEREHQPKSVPPMVPCPKCPSQVRKDRLSRHLARVHGPGQRPLAGSRTGKGAAHLFCGGDPVRSAEYRQSDKCRWCGKPAVPGSFSCYECSR